MDEIKRADCELVSSDKDFAETLDLKELIATTALSRVYRGWQKILLRPVAVKIIDADEQAEARLRREAKIVSSLDHPNIVKVFAFGRFDADHFYLATEWIEGGTLADKLSNGSPLSLSFTLEMLKPILDAVGYAHARGVVHRDLKPSNILLREGSSAEPVIADFGIARSMQGAAQSETITEKGVVMGSPLYISPEQCATKEVDSRADIYSLGAILCECLTGAPPYSGETIMEVMYKHLHEPPAKLEDRLLRSAGAPLCAVVLKCLARNPDDRYSSIDQLRNAAHNLQEASGQFEHKPVKGAGRSRKIWYFCLLSVVILMMVLVSDRHFKHDASEPLPVPVQRDPIDSSPPADAYRQIRDVDDSAQRLEKFPTLMMRAEKEGKPVIVAMCAAEMMVTREIKSDPERMKHFAKYYEEGLVRAKAPDMSFYHVGVLVAAASAPISLGLHDIAFKCLSALQKAFDEFDISGDQRGDLDMGWFEYDIKLGRFPEAEKDIQRARKSYQESPEKFLFTHLAEARLLYSRKKYKECRQALVSIAQFDGYESGDPLQVSDLQIQTCELLFRLGDKRWINFWNDARKNIESIELEHNGIRPRWLTQALLTKAANLTLIDEFRQAEQALAEANTVLSDIKQDVPWLKSQAEGTAGTIAYVQGKKQKAKAHLQRSIEFATTAARWDVGDKVARSYWLSGALKLQEGQKDEALKDFELARRLTSDWSNRWVREGAKHYSKVLRELHREGEASGIDKSLKDSAAEATVVFH